MDEDPPVINIDPVWQPPSLNVTLSLEGVPTAKWHEKFLEFHAWCLTQLQREGATHLKVNCAFIAGMSGILKHWFMSIGEYRQLELA